MSTNRRFRLLAVAIQIQFLWLATTGLAQSPPVVQSIEPLEAIAKRYQIEIVTTKPSFPVSATYGTIDGQEADRDELDRYAGLFAFEFKLYPAEFVGRSQLERVIFCRRLSFNGQLRNAIPDFEHDALYLDVTRGSYSRTYLQKVIHHEYFHIIDYRDDGRVYEDERWALLNPATFKYGTGGRFAQDSPETSILKNQVPGFLNHYSTTGVEEDKAELFANLIVDPEHVAERMSQDEVLKDKVLHLKHLLKTFSPQMDDVFWEKIREARRSDKNQHK